MGSAPNATPVHVVHHHVSSRVYGVHRSAIRAKGGPRALLAVLLKAPGDDAPICAVVGGLLAALADSQQPDLAAQVRGQLCSSVALAAG